MIENNSLSVAQLYYLEEKLENHILNWAVIPYNYDINFNNIGMEYTLLRDSEGFVYLITFQKGDKIEIDIETIKKIDTKAICESDKDYLNDKEEDTTNKNKKTIATIAHGGAFVAIVV